MTRNETVINGVVLLNKPLGISSNLALQKVKRLYAAKKAGHAGSLDPLATGMLPICFGEATKFCQFMLDADKSYTTVAKLGERTETGDAEGQVVETHDYRLITREQVEDALQCFCGEISQVPSMYSALKHQGVPLYKLARQGLIVERPARVVKIYEFKLLAFEPPFLTLQVKCSKGTYIRNLVEDLGTYLGIGAHVAKLHRNYVYPFQAEQMVALEHLQQSVDKSTFLLPINAMLSHMPQMLVSTEQREALYQGKIIQAEMTPLLSEGELVQLIQPRQGFLGVGEILPNAQLRVKRLMRSIS